MSILLPDMLISKITDISIETLKQRNIKGLLLDVDNTLSTHGGQKPLEGLLEWIGHMKSCGIKLIILSNATLKRVEPFAKKIGLDHISVALKPLAFGYLRGLKALDLKAKEVAMVGDQLFTDILGANIVGIFTIKVEPISPESGISFIIRRWLEEKILKRKLKG
ncbi:MAG TPA: YqeG family HAD IIIA-type phosphatase [Clostridiales bacterium]|nr:YqeG family HAD IIIA-type phosphatase [Clostridiales bacterium]